MKGTRVLVGFFVIAVLALFVYTTSRNPLGEERTKVLLTLTNWSEAEFAPVPEELSQIHELVSRIPLLSEAPLDSAVATGIRRSVAAMIAAYSLGSYEAFEEFRFAPTHSFPDTNYLDIKRRLTGLPGMVIYPKPPEWVVAGTREVIATTNSNPPIDPSLITKENALRYMFLWGSQGTQYKGYFSDVSISNSYVRITRVTSLPQPLHLAVISNEPNLGVAGCSGTPTIQYEDSPGSLLQKHNSFLLAYCKLHVRLAKPDPVTPVFSTFYYNPETKQWIPWELACASLMKNTAIRLFF